MLGSEKDGIDVYRAVRDADPDCRIFVMTGFPVPPERKEELGGADGLIMKPFDLVEVENLVSAISRKGT